MRVRVVIRVEPGTPRRGLWCPRCLLPSAVEVPLNTLTASGVRLIGTVRVCRECGEDT